MCAHQWRPYIALVSTHHSLKGGTLLTSTKRLRINHLNKTCRQCKKNRIYQIDEMKLMAIFFIDKLFTMA